MAVDGVPELMLRGQARYCRWLAANTANLATQSELARLADRLAAEADGILAQNPTRGPTRVAG